MDRLKQKQDLLVKLGMLLGPLQRLVERPDQYDAQERAEIIARYCAEYPSLLTEFSEFSKGQDGHKYLMQSARFTASLDGIVSRLMAEKELSDILPKQFAEAQSAIDAVPVPRTSVIVEAGSPFTAYCKLKELCEVDATKTITWLDPYFGANIFDRFISSVRANVPVTLVASEPGLNAGANNRNRWNGFLDVSRLYAQERGAALYRLVVQPSLHDRWVVYDERRIYALGGSAKDAGNKDYFTITGVDASHENLKKIQDNIDSGTEYFGPSTPTHL